MATSYRQWGLLSVAWIRILIWTIAGPVCTTTGFLLICSYFYAPAGTDSLLKKSYLLFFNFNSVIWSLSWESDDKLMEIESKKHEGNIWEECWIWMGIWYHLRGHMESINMSCFSVLALSFLVRSFMVGFIFDKVHRFFFFFSNIL